jgi:hypothetical protein
MHGNRNENRGPPMGRGQYGKPRLERLGTFRELTRSGGFAFTDPLLGPSSPGDGGPGCAWASSTSLTCTAP